MPPPPPHPEGGQRGKQSWLRIADFRNSEKKMGRVEHFSASLGGFTPKNKCHQASPSVPELVALPSSSSLTGRDGMPIPPLRWAGSRVRGGLAAIVSFQGNQASRFPRSTT